MKCYKGEREEDLSGGRDNTKLPGIGITYKMAWQVLVEKQCEVRHGKKFGMTLYEVVALSLYCLCFFSNFPLSPLQFTEAFRINSNLMFCFREMIVTVKTQFANRMVTM